MPTIVYRDGGLDPALLWSPLSLLDHLTWRSEWHTGGPRFDVEDTDDETVLLADVPGMTDDDIEITATGSTLIVRGERKSPGRRRIAYAPFERQFRLADGYDLDHVRAELADGVLTIRLPKLERAKPRRIKVQRSLGEKVKGLLSGNKD